MSKMRNLNVKMKRAYILIPTYNEAENILLIIQSILQQKQEIKKEGYFLHILVVDDNSPDKTGEKVRKYTKQTKANITVLVRTGKRGRGLAGREGYQYALDKGADVIIEMDADFSHDPQFLKQLIHATEKYDLVLGSRFVDGGKIQGRALWRNGVTMLANKYIQLMFNLNVKDCNSGYRCMKRKVLETINPTLLEAEGPDIVQEVLYYTKKNGFAIGEVPIQFKEREQGNSKLQWKHLIKGYGMVLKLWWRGIHSRSSQR